MNDLVNQNNNETTEVKVTLEAYEHNANRLTMINEQIKYDFYNHKAYSIINDTNKPNQPIRLWRSGNLYYYRPSPFSDLIVGKREEIAKEISSIYGNINIVIVDDLNDALSYKNAQMRIDTTYYTTPNSQDNFFKNLIL